jgi:hypothetical protein
MLSICPKNFVLFSGIFEGVLGYCDNAEIVVVERVRRVLGRLPTFWDDAKVCVRQRAILRLIQRCGNHILLRLGSLIFETNLEVAAYCCDMR